AAIREVSGGVREAGRHGDAQQRLRLPREGRSATIRGTDRGMNPYEGASPSRCPAPRWRDVFGAGLRSLTPWRGLGTTADEPLVQDLMPRGRPGETSPQPLVGISASSDARSSAKLSVRPIRENRMKAFAVAHCAFSPALVPA